MENEAADPAAEHDDSIELLNEDVQAWWQESGADDDLPPEVGEFFERLRHLADPGSVSNA